MTIQTIKMPDIGEGIAEVELVAWHVQVGDTVAEDQILADVMTDKATVEIPSHVAGKVISLDAAVGQVVAVGTEIIHIELEGAAGNEPPRPDILSIKPSAIGSHCGADPQFKTSELPGSRVEPGMINSVPVVGSTSVDHGGLKPALQGSRAVPTPSGSKPVAAPAVRRRAWELGIELSSVTGTGPAGRITQADLDAHVQQRGTRRTSAPADPRYAQRTAEEVIPVIGLRRKIAQKMQEAKRRIPHFTYVEEIDVTELEDLRTRLNTRHSSSRGRLTLLPFLIRAIVLAVREHPEVNARYDDEAAVVTRFAAVHLGLATQTSGGLMVPVIRHAETLDLWACAAEILRLAEAARSGKAAREELSGSTITVTSLGPLSGIAHTPVINHPEVAIVGPNRIVERPMIRNGLVVARKMMNISSSFDHRVVDGMNAAEFIQHVRGYLECPGTLLLD
jgi:2-oxoisovalerate dehydrogenase E2 component (dihydrolipoyl transacylase)